MTDTVMKKLVCSFNLRIMCVFQMEKEERQEEEEGHQVEGRKEGMTGRADYKRFVKLLK